MDYRKMLQQHDDCGSDITLATLLIPPEDCPRFGVVQVDADSRITGFDEKPKETKIRSPYNPAMVSVSMGVYLFNTDVLIPVLLKDAEDPASKHDFGKDILPKMVDEYRVYAYNFEDENKKEALYWRDVGTLEAYYEANMDMVAVSPVFNLYDADWPIRTHQRQYPPAKLVFAEEGRTGSAVDSIITGGAALLLTVRVSGDGRLLYAGLTLLPDGRGRPSPRKNFPTQRRKSLRVSLYEKLVHRAIRSREKFLVRQEHNPEMLRAGTLS